MDDDAPITTRAASAAQRSVQLHIAEKVVNFLARLDLECPAGLPWLGSFASGSASTTSEPIKSDKVDLPKRAATCNFLLLGRLRTQVKKLLNDVRLVFWR